MSRSPRYRLLGVVASSLVAASCAAAGPAVRPAPFPSLSRPPAFHDTARPPVLGSLSGSRLVQMASRLQGIRYRLGGESPADGFDCSGFVRYVYGMLRIALPRTVIEQYGFGSTIADGDRPREGDLVFFSTTAPGPSHVGLVLGDGTFIHAPGASGVVRIERMDSPYWQLRIVSVKRIL